jgi:hypothetical protein
MWAWERGCRGSPKGKSPALGGAKWEETSPQRGRPNCRWQQVGLMARVCLFPDHHWASRAWILTVELQDIERVQHGLADGPVAVERVVPK